jgi:sterol-4alpha-carboxylate 3-dehydrogenase (decarboxylating)
MAAEKKTIPKNHGDVGRVLVIGGNGFLGHHIVNQLLGETWTASHVSSIDLSCDRNRNERAVYRECDITDTEKLQSVLEELKPDVVIHTASPVALDGNKARDLLRRVNVEGTRSVVQACQNVGVKALVYTASASVISDGVNGLYNADERWPVLRHSAQKDYYAETKVGGDAPCSSLNVTAAASVLLAREPKEGQT